MSDEKTITLRFEITPEMQDRLNAALLSSRERAGRIRIAPPTLAEVVEQALTRGLALGEMQRGELAGCDRYLDEITVGEFAALMGIADLRAHRKNANEIKETSAAALAETAQIFADAREIANMAHAPVRCSTVSALRALATDLEVLLTNHPGKQIAVAWAVVEPKGSKPTSVRPPSTAN